MNSAIDQIVLVGGGTAGWLAACTIAARRPEARITLIEAPDIATIGVGEGTWPTMRRTLSAIGIAEEDFLEACDASFKQGSRFAGWADGTADDAYLHPFTAPPEQILRDPLGAWASAPERAFADIASAQAEACRARLAPRQKAMPDYAGALNYAYHLDAGKLATLLRTRACEGLGVTHIQDRVTSVTRKPGGEIAAVVTRANGAVAGDLFLDCTGHAGLLIDKTLGVLWIDRSEVLFNDRALAVQIPVEAGSPIASPTLATAHEAGWIWDIGLPTRRGIGCVYASSFMDEDAARKVLAAYVATSFPDLPFAPESARSLHFSSGHRARFWEGNCLAIGLSAGFLEPLEASAIVMIELSLEMLLDNWPADAAAMVHHAARFNRRFTYRWDRIVDFLKLHYVLSRREEPYWRAHRAAASIPASLAEHLAVWAHQPPSPWDFPEVDEVFPCASHQYVLYGMQGAGLSLAGHAAMPAGANQQVLQLRQRARALAAALPTNRAYLDSLQRGASKQATEAA